MRKTAVFGGTFNPIHNGHLVLGETLAQRLNLDRVLLIPTASPPHKQAPHLIAAEHRLAMCRLAVKDHPLFIVSDLEIRRGGKSYTVDTLRDLHRQFPHDRLYLLTGADMFLTLQDWRQFPQIARLAVLCGVPRNEADAAALGRHAQLLAQLGACCVTVNVKPPDVSSTQVRALIRAQKSIKGLVPDAVLEYIKEYQMNFWK